MFFGRPWNEWVAQYSASHRNSINRLCHTIGIPLIIVSFLLAPLAIFLRGFWKLPLSLFVIGWIFQFVGHAFEGKPPEFLHDWRFLLVGARWWVAKIKGRA